MSRMAKNDKYILTDETKKARYGSLLRRIQALRDIGSMVKAGDKGGWIEHERNLSQSGNAWVSGNARVYGDAWVSGNAHVYGSARIYGNAEVYGNAHVYGDARVYGNAWVSGNARVYGDALVSGSARVYGDAWVSGNAQVYGSAHVYGRARVYGDARVYGNTPIYGDAHLINVNLCAVRSDGYTFSLVATPEGRRIIAGCRYFSFKEAREHWTRTRGGTALGEETQDILDFLEKQANRYGLDKPMHV